MTDYEEINGYKIKRGKSPRETSFVIPDVNPTVDIKRDVQEQISAINEINQELKRIGDKFNYTTDQKFKLMDEIFRTKSLLDLQSRDVSYLKRQLLKLRKM